MNDNDFAHAKTREVQVLTREGDVFRLTRLCSVLEFYRAYAEIACILGGALKQVLSTLPASRYPRVGEWMELDKFLGSPCSGELLWGLCGQESFDALRHVSQLAWRGVWPEGKQLANGMERPRKALEDLGNLLEMPYSYPAVHASSNAGLSLQKRVLENLKKMKALGLEARSEPLIHRICEQAAAGCVFMVVSCDQGAV